MQDPVEGRDSGTGWETYAGSRVVARKVDLQVSHWMFMALALVLSCDLAAPFASFALRSRFCAALAPCVECLVSNDVSPARRERRRNGGRFRGKTHVASAHGIGR